MATKTLKEAKNNKKDEFYTLIEDISEELNNYKKHFKDKVVLCNCDDPEWSNFWIFFHQNFEEFGLKKLISTHYNKDGSSSYVMEYTGGNDVDPKDWHQRSLKGNGDFASEECIELLKEADITCSNPPFSLFRSYLSLLIEHNKKFIIWANNNCITYKEVFPLIKENKMWLGYMSNKTCHFRIPDDYKKYDKKFTEQRNDGYRYATVPAISTFTNLDIPKRHFELLPSLKKEFANHPELYQKYDNYDAINVDKVKDIPYDYFGVMGVPITFFDKFNPDEFEIIGMSQRGCHPEEMELKKYDDYYEMTKDKKKTGSSGSKTNGNPNLSQNDGKHNYFENKEGHIVQSCYQRVFIKQKEKQNAK